MSDRDGANPHDDVPDQEHVVDDLADLSSLPQSRHGSRDVWKASASFGRLIGLSIVCVTVLLALLTFWQFLQGNGGFRIVWLVAAVLCGVAAASAGYLLYGLTTLRYVLGPDYLVVEWLRERRVIPLADIRDVTFEPRVPVPWRRWEWLWPGYYISTVHTPHGAWRSYATQPPRRRVRLATPEGIIAISPERPVLFIAELAERRRLAESAARDAFDAAVPIHGPSGAVSRQPRHATEGQVGSAPTVRVRKAAPRAPSAWVYAYRHLFREQLLGDDIASTLVAVGVVLPVLMAGYLFSQYEGLPNAFPIHWDAHGQADQVGTPRTLWRFPLTAVLFLVANTALATLVVGVDRFLARLLTAATPVAQLVAFVALIRLVN